MDEGVDQLLAWAGSASHTELKAAWKEYCPDWVLPKKTSVQFLAMAITWRLQEQAFGSHSPEVLALLRRGAPKKKAGDRILPGTVLRRTWRGDLYEVMALEKGFAFEGDVYRSLSEIARMITGTRWSGPAFFGLRERGKKARALETVA